MYMCTCVYVFVHVCAHVCTRAHTQEPEEGIASPEAEITGGFKLRDMGAEK